MCSLVHSQAKLAMRLMTTNTSSNLHRTNPKAYPTGLLPAVLDPLAGPAAAAAAAVTALALLLLLVAGGKLAEVTGVRGRVPLT